MKNVALCHHLEFVGVFVQCEWLLGDRKPSPEELDKGIDTNSPLFQAILENPVVQLGLTNPKTLLGESVISYFDASAFLSKVSAFVSVAHV